MIEIVWPENASQKKQNENKNFYLNKAKIFKKL